MGFVFQQFHLVPHLNALENVMLAQYFHSMTDETEALAALKQVGMEGARHASALAAFGRRAAARGHRARAGERSEDHPGGRADRQPGRREPAHRLPLLSDLHAQGRTIVMVTHDENAGKLADRRLNLEHGRIKENLVFSAEENQDFDEVLEHLWARNEVARAPAASGSSHRIARVHADAVEAADCDHGAHRAGDGRERHESFTPKGEARARDVIRRHRLAERLFMDVLSIRDEREIESSACKFEHILSPEVTDRMCTLLGHPTACPHGSPIPQGECCNQKRVLAPAEMATVLVGVKSGMKSI